MPKSQVVTIKGFEKNFIEGDGKLVVPMHVVDDSSDSTTAWVVVLSNDGQGHFQGVCNGARVGANARVRGPIAESEGGAKVIQNWTVTFDSPVV